MFTGIIESIGTIKEIRVNGLNKDFRISAPLAHELKVDQSVSHNGVCLTVTTISGDSYWVTAIEETLKRSNLGSLVTGDRVNIERCMLANGRFDGHIVQGHVDQTATVSTIEDRDGSFLVTFVFDPSFGNILVDKGSVCVNGVSLTCFDTTNDSFTVAIIPYTYENTNFHKMKPGDVVNLEFDIIGKYIQKILKR